MAIWTLTYDSYDPAEEGLREALLSTGNGFFCTRAAAEWADISDVHYPGTYVHGGFNRATTIMAGRPVVNEDFVNLPNWLVLKLKIDDGEPFKLDNVELMSYRQELDIRHNVMSRTLRFRDRDGRETTLASRRFVSMADQHLAALEWTVTAENWSGRLEILSALDGRVKNWGVPRYRDLECYHLNAVTTRAVGHDTIALLVQTRQSRIYVAEAARTRVYGESEVIPVERGVHQLDGYIHQTLGFSVQEKAPVRVEKMVAVYTSRDNAISEPLINAQNSAVRYSEFTPALERHQRAWDQLWTAADVRIPGDERVQKLVRFHIAHILQVCSPHTADIDAGVPARGLNGEAYRGHVFWDELYIYPFLNYRLPEVTRELLMYRYRRLDEARCAAREHGYRGAMYPWQSGSDGTEETQVVHLNPKSGRWDPDLSHNQRHVNAAIFYNIWEYYRTTGDVDFLWDHGAEMMLEIALFWSSIAHFNAERDRFEIHGVMGPDEFHEKYPGRVEEGLRNNAYTNVMVAWICETVGRILDILPEQRRRALTGKLGLTDDDVARFEEMSRKMFVPFHKDGIISQFEGYEDLEELDWDAYRARYDNIQRLDRILKAEGDDPDRYKLAKQADTLMLFFLFPEERLKRLFDKLGYPYEPDTAERNIKYYDKRTSHGSTLSFIVHAAIEAELDPEGSWDMFLAALESDIGDIQGGTTREGIHMGVMAGTLDLIQRAYLGSEVRDDMIIFKPKLTERLNGLAMPLEFRETPLEVVLEDGSLTVNVLTHGHGNAVKVGVNGTVKEIPVGESHRFELSTSATRTGTRSAAGARG
ncbi:MAG: glycoside hydrolase family 65 protein [Rhodospirillales bacterium]|nr:MAG: glycoside hydrolase family 65 protein [Rhodospirillales bacterium]